VTKVPADILLALDKGNIDMLTLLDLSAAFDTVDHAILLRRLEVSYGLGAVLSWSRSYLDGRTQFIRCGRLSSDPSAFICGVPQGSVLGPILFLLYTYVLQRLDSGNATLVGLPAYQLSRLQSVLNAAARLVFSRSKYDHVTPVLR